jgi:glycosyltransferase involved in cell wall biosynthesis
MRLLFVTNTFTPDYTGGAEVALYHSCRALIQAGFSCRVLYVNNRRQEARHDHYVVDGIPVERVTYHTRWPWQELFDRRIMGTVLRSLRAWRPELVHVHNVSGASLAPFVACRLAGVPVVSTLHDLWLLCPNNMLYRQDGKPCSVAEAGVHGCGQCLRRYDYWGAMPYRRTLFSWLTAPVRYFITPSQAMIERHVEAGYARTRFRRVRHAIAEEAAPAQLPPMVESALAKAQGRPTLVFAGGGVEIKGARLVLQALPGLLQRLPDLRLLVAGGGDTDTLAALRQVEDPAGRAVQLLGHVPFTAMGAVYGAGDLTLLPSVWHEAYSMVIHESFQHGTPAVATDFGAPPELVTPGETGYLFPRGDAAALAAQVVHHFEQPPHLRRQMRHHCIRYARRELSVEAHVAALTDVYADALNREG